MEAVLGDSSSGAKKTPAFAFPAPEVKFPALLRGDAEESELSLSLERTRDAVS